VEATTGESQANPVFSRFGAHRRFWLGFSVFVAAFAAVALTLTDPGLVWDETIYIGSAVRHAQWFESLGRGSFTREQIEWHWGGRMDHPPLAKVGMALGVLLLHKCAPLVVAWRLPPAALFALLVLAIYLFMAGHFGERAGVLSAVSLALMPRVFGQAHFGEIDMPMACLWFLTTAAFVKGIASPRWAVATGVIFGLALLTKVNAVFLPFVLAPWGLAFHGRKALPNLVAMATISPLLFLAGWPVLWIDLVGKLKAFVADKTKRAVIETYYFGHTYTKPFAPWHYPLVMTLITVPTGQVAAAVVGVAANARAFVREPVKALIALNLCVILGLMCLPGVPKYDGVRLFMPAFPFVACLAGLGLARIWDALAVRWPPRWAAAAVAAFMAVQIVPLAAIHPYELSYYSALVGGLRGAHKLGMETTYWGDTVTSDVLDYVNARCPKGGKVCFFPIGDFIPPTYQDATGELRKDLRFSTEIDPDYDLLVLLPRQGKFNEKAWRLYRTGKPVFQVERQGVPLCLVYGRDG